MKIYRGELIRSLHSHLCLIGDFISHTFLGGRALAELHRMSGFVVALLINRVVIFFSYPSILICHTMPLFQIPIETRFVASFH